MPNYYRMNFKWLSAEFAAITVTLLVNPSCKSLENQAIGRNVP